MFAIAACAFGVGGSWPFPYSVAALTGTVGVWWALEIALASESWAGSIAAGIVAGFAAFKDHLSYLPFSGSVLPELAGELEGYTMTKSALHFSVDRPLPKALLKNSSGCAS